MTVGYLKEHLDQFPDDARVILDLGGPRNKIDSKDFEVLTIFGFKSPENLKNFVMLQTRRDFDYMEELKAKIEYLKDVWQGCHPEDWEEILLNQGFTKEEIKEALNEQNTAQE